MCGRHLALFSCQILSGPTMLVTSHQDATEKNTGRSNRNNGNMWQCSEKEKAERCGSSGLKSR
jgi:hypothetical protein